MVELTTDSVADDVDDDNTEWVIIEAVAPLEDEGEECVDGVDDSVPNSDGEFVDD